MLVLALAGCGARYPDRIVEPDLIGVVASIKTDPDLTAHVILTSGEQLALGRQDRSLGGLGELLFVGYQPERWFLAGHASERPNCFSVSASRAFSDSGAVLLVFENWPGIGIRLQKAPGFDDRRRVTTDAQGHLPYSSMGGISLCADVEGRITDVQ